MRLQVLKFLDTFEKNTPKTNNLSYLIEVPISYAPHYDGGVSL